MKVKILAVDTCTNVCSLCVMDGDRTVAQYMTVGERTHTERLMDAIETLFSHLDFGIEAIQGLAVTNGPGSFTGLRISLSVIKGLAFALNIPVVTASSLEVAAMQITEIGFICPALDARRNEVFAALFERTDEGLFCLLEPRSVLPAVWEKQLPDAPILFCGPGAHLYWSTLQRTTSKLVGPPDLVLATTMAHRAQKLFVRREFISANELNAAYLRPSDAEARKIANA